MPFYSCRYTIRFQWRELCELKENQVPVIKTFLVSFCFDDRLCLIYCIPSAYKHMITDVYKQIQCIEAYIYVLWHALAKMCGAYVLSKLNVIYVMFVWLCSYVHDFPLFQSYIPMDNLQRFKCYTVQWDRLRLTNGFITWNKIWNWDLSYSV